MELPDAGAGGSAGGLRAQIARTQSAGRCDVPRAAPFRFVSFRFVWRAVCHMPPGCSPPRSRVEQTLDIGAAAARPPLLRLFFFSAGLPLAAPVPSRPRGAGVPRRGVPCDAMRCDAACAAGERRKALTAVERGGRAAVPARARPSRDRAEAKTPLGRTGRAALAPDGRPLHRPTSAAHGRRTVVACGDRLPIPACGARRQGSGMWRWRRRACGGGARRLRHCAGGQHRARSRNYLIADAAPSRAPPQRPLRARRPRNRAMQPAAACI